MKPTAVMVCYPDGRVSYRDADDLITMYEGVIVTPLYTMTPRLTVEEIAVFGDRLWECPAVDVPDVIRAIERRVRREE